MKIKFLNSNDDELIINEPYNINIDDIEFNAEINEPLFGEIADVISSLTPKINRKIEIELVLSKKTDLDFRERLMDFIKFFDRSNAPFYIIDYENNIEYFVILSSIKNITRDSAGLELRFTKLKLIFTMLDPFARSIDYISNTFTINNQAILNFYINNNSIINYPIFEIISSDIFQSLEIISEKNYLLLNTNFYEQNSKLIIDSYNSKILNINLNIEKDVSIFLTKGGLPILYPGNNNFYFYFSNQVSGNITIKYKKRYLL